jgi:hypothetical protein
VYERFALQDPDGRPDPTRGIREFVVGTGGAIALSVPDQGREQRGAAAGRSAC